MSAVSEFQTAGAKSTVNTCHIMHGSMVDIQSAENRRGKKEERKKKPQDENRMACPTGQP